MSSTLHDDAGTMPSATVEVSEGIFAYIQTDGSWWINNTGFLVGKDRVLAVDSCATESRSRAFLRAIASVTGNPVRTLVNTHHHGDHSHGNFLFAEATVVAHEQCREAILLEGPPATADIAGSGVWGTPPWGDIRLAPPFLTFDDKVNVYVDDLRCEIRHIGIPAHTTNDSIVWIPERSVLFAGDLVFNGGTPFLLAGSVQGSVTALQTLRDLGADTIVPGHGPVAGPEVIDEVLDYLRFVQEVAVRGEEAGLSPLEAARETDLGRFAELSDSERIVGNLHRAYAELAGAAPGAAVDVRAALGDMVAYNGGRPLTCLV